MMYLQHLCPHTVTIKPTFPQGLLHTEPSLHFTRHAPNLVALAVGEYFYLCALARFDDLRKCVDMVLFLHYLVYASSIKM